MVAVSWTRWCPAMSTHIFKFWFIIARYSVLIASLNIVGQIVFYTFTCNSGFKWMVMNIIQRTVKSVAIFANTQTCVFQIFSVFQKRRK